MIAEATAESLISPVEEALIALFKTAKTKKERKEAEENLAVAFRNLLTEHPDIDAAEVAIEAAKRLGIISAELRRTEEALRKIKAFDRRDSGGGGGGQEVGGQEVGGWSQRNLL